MQESTGWKWFWTIGGIAIALLLAGVFFLQTIALILFYQAFEDLPAPRAVASIVTDELVESGLFSTRSAAEAPLLEKRSVLLTHAINEQSSREVVEKIFLLNAEDPTAPIDLYLASPGGWGGSAFAIIDAMQRVEAPVNTHAIGLCYSACALVLTSATGRRTAAPNAIVMIHANLGTSSEPYSYEKLAQDRYESLYREYSALPESWFPMTEDKMYYLSAQEALDFKIIDEVIPPGKKQGFPVDTPAAAIP
jgi:ATP-dependent Clp protease protease subunit